MADISASSLVEFKDVTFSYPVPRATASSWTASPVRAPRQGHGADGRLGRRQDHRAAPDRRPAEGHRRRLLFDGKDVGKLVQRRALHARRRMGMLFQFGALFTDLSVFDNVAFPCASTPRCRSA
jgi:phospholipid/cholesterol/gamma-HCH transport system ATP-binding protein